MVVKYDMEESKLQMIGEKAIWKLLGRRMMMK
jgi:hypothetical protein